MRKKVVNYYVDVAILIIFVALAYTGMLLQIVYHMKEHSSDFLVMSLNRSNWLVIHKILSIASSLGIGLHIILHLDWFKAVIKKRLFMKRSFKKKISFYLLIVYSISTVVSFVSWFFNNSLMGYNPTLRHTLVEIHDSISIVLVMMFCGHLIKSSRWLLNTTRNVILSPR
ncbi:MAG: DUF4405 domain-containing protein [Chloroflexi bacterium]|nr:DUF4405 domain-containing protein [Chloroflexota bacterium]